MRNVNTYGLCRMEVPSHYKTVQRGFWPSGNRSLSPAASAALPQPFEQAIVNEIVLWKVNRYARLSSEALKKLNSIADLSPASHRSASEAVAALLDELFVGPMGIS